MKFTLFCACSGKRNLYPTGIYLAYHKKREHRHLPASVCFNMLSLFAAAVLTCSGMNMCSMCYSGELQMQQLKTASFSVEETVQMHNLSRFSTEL